MLSAAFQHTLLVHCPVFPVSGFVVCIVLIDIPKTEMVKYELIFHNQTFHIVIL